MIKHTKYLTEADIQAELYSALRHEAIEVGLEQKITLPTKTKTGRPEKIRIDVGIFINGELIASIEVKRNHKRPIPEIEKSRQRRKYEQLGLPYHYCMGMQGVPEAIGWACRQCALR